MTMDGMGKVHFYAELPGPKKEIQVEIKPYC